MKNLNYSKLNSYKKDMINEYLIDIDIANYITIQDMYLNSNKKSYFNVKNEFIFKDLVKNNIQTINNAKIKILDHEKKKDLMDPNIIKIDNSNFKRYNFSKKNINNLENISNYFDEKYNSINKTKNDIIKNNIISNDENDDKKINNYCNNNDIKPMIPSYLKLKFKNKKN